jgi:hypothetical protein
LTFTLAPGVAELVSASVRFRWHALDEEGGSVLGDVNDEPLSVDQNTLSVDLSGQIPEGVWRIDSIVLNMRDACGTETTMDDFLFSNDLDLDAGSVINIFCETPP